MPAPSVRVVVRLPYNRPENAPSDPPRIEWTAEKADILWKVIERSRSIESGGAADWKGLAAHLEVPLPYLLYRVNARFQEEIRGLKDISGALSPISPNHSANKAEQGERHSGHISARMGGSSIRLGRGPNGLPSPIGVRARLNSLGGNSIRQKKATSSSTITVQAPKRPSIPEPISPASSEDEETDSEDEQISKEEEADRKAEEQDVLDRKLQELQQMMTNDALGLVSTRERRERGRRWPASPSSPASLSTHGYSRRDDTLSSRSASESQSVSSTGSLQGSILDIPSPSNGWHSHSSMGRHLSPAKSSSPASLSPGLATGRRYAPISMSQQGSNHGSETSSFSDISDSISASALESALMSNIRGNGSRLYNTKITVYAEQIDDNKK